jgi:hypothetical protein
MQAATRMEPQEGLAGRSVGGGRSRQAYSDTGEQGMKKDKEKEEQRVEKRKAECGTDGTAGGCGRW